MSTALRTNYEHEANLAVTVGRPERKQSAMGEMGRLPKLGVGRTKTEISKRRALKSTVCV